MEIADDLLKNNAEKNNRKILSILTESSYLPGLSTLTTSLCALSLNYSLKNIPDQTFFPFTHFNPIKDKKD